MPELEPLARPASHRWTVVLLGFCTLVFASFTLRVMSASSGADPRQHLVLILFSGVFMAALVSLLWSRRRRWGYYVVSMLLGVSLLRGLYTMALFVHPLIFGEAPAEAPYFQIFAGDRPFALVQPMSTARLIPSGIFVLLIAWLFVRFAFGTPSRRYYSFPERVNK